MEPCLESLWGEGWNRTLSGDSGDQLRYIAQYRQLGGEVGKTGCVRCRAGPQIDIPECIGAAPAQTAFIVMRQEFGLVGRNIDANGAVTLASLAGQAEVERPLHFLAAPAVVDDFALRHFP